MLLPHGLSGLQCLLPNPFLPMGSWADFPNSCGPGYWLLDYLDKSLTTILRLLGESRTWSLMSRPIMKSAFSSLEWLLDPMWLSISSWFVASQYSCCLFLSNASYLSPFLPPTCLDLKTPFLSHLLLHLWDNFSESWARHLFYFLQANKTETNNSRLNNRDLSFYHPGGTKGETKVLRILALPGMHIHLSPNLKALHSYTSLWCLMACLGPDLILFPSLYLL